MIQEYAGFSHYRADYLHGAHLLIVAVPCRFEKATRPSLALLDTASTWCVLPGEVATEAGYDLKPDPLTPPLHTRFGLIHGRLERMDIVLPAEEGEDLPVSATCFLSEDWPGPPVLGWKGFLERLRFALDPNEERFYFAPL